MDKNRGDTMGRTLCALIVLVALANCGGGTSEAIKRGVGAECSASLACTETNQVCLPEFAGGYCGVSACMRDSDCPAGSACVTDDNQTNYCFLICADKPECNVRRSVANESNCTSSLSFVDGAMGRKVCRPPLSGTGPIDAGTD
jgi:hypothetical protein